MVRVALRRNRLLSVPPKRSPNAVYAMRQGEPDERGGPIYTSGAPQGSPGRARFLEHPGFLHLVKYSSVITLRFENRSGRQFIVLQILPKRHQQFSGQRHDTHFPHSLIALAEALLVPLA